MTWKNIQMLAWSFPDTQVSSSTETSGVFWYNTICQSCNPNLKTINMPWFSETSIVYEIKKMGGNKYIEILWTQVKISIAPNPLLDLVWTSERVYVSLEDILQDPNQSDSTKLDVSPFTYQEIELQWNAILDRICETESLDKNIKAYFKIESWWYKQFFRNNEREKYTK